MKVILVGDNIALYRPEDFEAFAHINDGPKLELTWSSTLVDDFSYHNLAEPDFAGSITEPYYLDEGENNVNEYCNTSKRYAHENESEFSNVFSFNFLKGDVNLGRRIEHFRYCS